MGTGDKMRGWGVTLRWTSIPSGEGGGGVAVFLVASCYRIPVKLRPCGPLWVACDFTWPVVPSGYKAEEKEVFSLNF